MEKQITRLTDDTQENQPTEYTGIIETHTKNSQGSTEKCRLKYTGESNTLGGAGGVRQG